jgi:hypothetical protein
MAIISAANPLLRNDTAWRKGEHAKKNHAEKS